MEKRRKEKEEEEEEEAGTEIVQGKEEDDEGSDRMRKKGEAWKRKRTTGNSRVLRSKLIQKK